MKRTKVIDLFAGVGGLSLGAARAGFDVVAAVELDHRAISQHAINFPSSRHIAKDVSTITGSWLRDESGIKKNEAFGLIGGPPCQGFSDMGLRQEDDPRNQLLSHFFRLVAEARPAFFVAENVPGLLKERNKGVLKKALEAIPEGYSVLQPILVKASNFGAPTIRTRVFFIGYDPAKIEELEQSDFLPSVVEDVRVGRALEGLPALRSTWSTEAESWRRVRYSYSGIFEERLVDMIPPNVGDGKSIRLLEKDKLVSGFFGTIHAPSTVERFQRLRPGASDPISKCTRLSKFGYCPTLRAGTGPDRGSHQALRPIHPTSPRVISPREGARLQGFPDWFQFHPTKWHAFRQIGNSVSPIVSEAIMGRIARQLI